jgi:hypothetical protein
MFVFLGNQAELLSKYRITRRLGCAPMMCRSLPKMRLVLQSANSGG